MYGNNIQCMRDGVTSEEKRMSVGRRLWIMGIRVDGCFEICYKHLYVAFLINTLAPLTLQIGKNSAPSLKTDCGGSTGGAIPIGKTATCGWAAWWARRFTKVLCPNTGP